MPSLVSTAMLACCLLFAFSLFFFPLLYASREQFPCHTLVVGLVDTEHEYKVIWGQRDS